MDEQVAALADRYSQRAEAYDSLWSPAILPFAVRLLDHLPLPGALQVLDVGTGAGALLPAIKRAAPGAVVSGIDSSEGMLQLARARHQGPLALMDAQSLEFPDDGFDVVIAAFVLFHLPDPGRCLDEICRVLRPHGAVGALTWAEEEYPAADTIWDEVLADAGANVQPLAATDSRMRSNTTAKMIALLKRAGFSHIQAWMERVEYRWQAARHFQYHIGSTSRARLSSLTAADRDLCLQRVAERLSDAADDDYVFRGAVVFSTAVK